jgi:hypothetical protein
MPGANAIRGIGGRRRSSARTDSTRIVETAVSSRFSLVGSTSVKPPPLTNHSVRSSARAEPNPPIGGPATPSSASYRRYRTRYRRVSGGCGEFVPRHTEQPVFHVQPEVPIVIFGNGANPTIGQPLLPTDRPESAA